MIVVLPNRFEYQEVWCSEVFGRWRGESQVDGYIEISPRLQAVELLNCLYI